MAIVVSSILVNRIMRSVDSMLEATARSRKFPIRVSCQTLISRTRFVWLTPAELTSDGCLHAFDASGLLGMSSPVKVKSTPLKKRSTLSEIDDPYGPWFDGVAYLQSKNHSDTFVAGKKDQKIAILGGGMAGLMSGLLLDQVGIHNWEISESSDRIGGYVRSKVFADRTGDFVPPT